MSNIVNEWVETTKDKWLFESVIFRTFVEKDAHGYWKWKANIRRLLNFSWDLYAEQDTYPTFQEAIVAATNFMDAWQDVYGAAFMKLLNRQFI